MSLKAFLSPLWPQCNRGVRLRSRRSSPALSSPESRATISTGPRNKPLHMLSHGPLNSKSPDGRNAARSCRSTHAGGKDELAQKVIDTTGRPTGSTDPSPNCQSADEEEKESGLTVFPLLGARCSQFSNPTCSVPECAAGSFLAPPTPHSCVWYWSSASTSQPRRK